jgi:hypothetical protein
VLAEHFGDKAGSIVIFTRGAAWQKGNLRAVRWDGATPGDWQEHLEGADLLVNLTGKNVNCRYTEENRREILRSRLDATEALGKAVAAAGSPPRVWIQFTSATIYRHAEDFAMDEIAGETGYGFSVDVCQKWEKAFWAQPAPHTRKVALRTSIVLGRRDGAFPRLLNLVRLGLGGRQGNGRQYVSWIHESDVAGIVEWVAGNESVSGVYNCTAPGPVPNAQLMQTIREAYGVPAGLPAPTWLLEIGAELIGTETELILKSRWVVPAKLLQAGYLFQFPQLVPAVHDLISIRQ